MRDKLRSIIKSKSISEMLDNISWDMIEMSAFAILFMLVLTPLYQLMSDIVAGKMRGFEYSYSVTMRWVMSITLALGIVILFVCMGKKIKDKTYRELKEKKAVLFFSGFILWMIISTVINGFDNLAIYGDSYRQESLFSYITYAAVYFSFGAMIRNVKYRELLVYVFIMVSTALALFVAIFPNPDFYGGGKISSIFFHFNHYGYYLTMSILLSGVMLLFEKRSWARVLCAVMFAFGTALLVWNETFGCYLAVFAGIVFACIVMSICKKSFDARSLLLLGIFVAVSAIMSIGNATLVKDILKLIGDVDKMNKNASISCNAGTGRGVLYIWTLNYIHQNPLFGHGVEGVAERLMLDTRGVCDRSHNEILQYAAFFGLPAAVMYVCGVLSVYFNGLKNKLMLDPFAMAVLVASFGYLVSSMFGNTTLYLTPYLFMFLGMGYVKVSKKV